MLMFDQVDYSSMWCYRSELRRLLERDIFFGSFNGARESLVGGGLG
jgi:hypothetical protein